jgi:hypothetical protein
MRGTLGRASRAAEAQDFAAPSPLSALDLLRPRSSCSSGNRSLAKVREQKYAIVRADHANSRVHQVKA